MSTPIDAHRHPSTHVDTRRHMSSLVDMCRHLSTCVHSKSTSLWTFLWTKVDNVDTYVDADADAEFSGIEIRRPGGLTKPIKTMHFNKLFSTITSSTIWDESKETRLVWVTMLAMADRRGQVHAAIPGLAHQSRVTTKECQEALSVLMAPDPFSRTTEHEGRRIKEISGGWQLLNHGKYRQIMSTEERRAYKTAWAAEKRAEEKAEAERKALQQAAEAPPLATDDVKEFE